MTRLYVVHLKETWGRGAVRQLFVDAPDAREAVKQLNLGPPSAPSDYAPLCPVPAVIAVVIQATGEHVPKDLWQ